MYECLQWGTGCRRYFCPLLMSTNMYLLQRRLFKMRWTKWYALFMAPHTPVFFQWAHVQNSCGGRERGYIWPYSYQWYLSSNLPIAETSIEFLLCHHSLGGNLLEGWFYWASTINGRCRYSSLVELTSILHIYFSSLFLILMITTSSMDSQNTFSTTMAFLHSVTPD